ncbi:unnamed protein product [Globisporangium polare]
MSGGPSAAADAKEREGAVPHPNSPSKTLRQLSVKQRAAKESLFASLETAMVVIVLTTKAVIVPLVLIAVFVTTRYISSATLFRLPAESFTVFKSDDPDMARACPNCLSKCESVVSDLSQFGSRALMSELTFSSLVEKTLGDYSYAHAAVAEALGTELDAAGAICGGSSKDEDAAQEILFVVSKPVQILQLVKQLELSVAQDMLQEITAAADQQESGNASALCSGARWGILAHTKLLSFLPSLHSNIYSTVSASDLTLFTDFPECRVDKGFANSESIQLAHDTSGTDLAASMTSVMLLFPHDFTAAAVSQASRSVSSTRTGSVSGGVAVQPFIRGYYGGCIVRVVNATGIYVDSDCTIDSQWVDYGLMHQYPDNIPLCSSGGICVHTYYNSQPDYFVSTSVGGGSADLTLVPSTFGFRYADSYDLSILPGLVVVQILLVSILALYQVMLQKRSVLLTQIWAYRCQNGLAQIVYLFQITYHLYLYSDLYFIALITGTASVETVVNLTCCAYAFSYSFVNILKARIGKQQLHRAFRLTWEVLPLAFSGALGYSLSVNRTVRIHSLMTMLGESLARATSAKGVERCKATESCVVFKGNLALLIVLLALFLWLVAEVIVFGLRLAESSSPVDELKSSVRSLQTTIARPVRWLLRSKSAVRVETQSTQRKVDALTTFEEYCLGGPFHRLFQDCDAVSSIERESTPGGPVTRYSTLEAVALAGFIFGGNHLYRADDTPLLLVTRVLPTSMLRTFNFLVIRWRVDMERATVAKPTVCHWATVNLGPKVETRAMPLA